MASDDSLFLLSCDFEGMHVSYLIFIIRYVINKLLLLTSLLIS